MLFGKVGTFVVAQQLDPQSNTDIETVAEIVDATEDGIILVYSDAARGVIGFVDIQNPNDPTPLGTVDVGGEPTSVAVAGNYALASVNTSTDFINTSGTLKVIDIASRELVRELALGGQPDSIAVSPDGMYAAVAIENERNEDLGSGDIIDSPQPPAGFVQIIDMGTWEVTRVELTEAILASAGIDAPSDPEPEYIDINEDNIAVVTLQENNGIVLIDLEAKAVINAFSAGNVDLSSIDATEDDLIEQSESLLSVPREPDGVAWIDDTYFAISNEGDMRGGSRGFSIFDNTGKLIFDSGNELEIRAAALGHYPEGRSENKGNEPENIEFAEFGGEKLLFVNSERANLVFVYNVDRVQNPIFKQVLPAGVGPEGAKAIPGRNLLVVASEVDDRDIAIRSSISIYQQGEGALYPTLESELGSGTPIPWTALSGLSAGGPGQLFTVQDSFLKKSTFFTIDTTGAIPTITKATTVKDSDGVLAGIGPQGEFSASDLAELINDDKTVNLDFEGIAYDGNGHVFIVSEGSGTSGDPARPVESLNFLLKVQVDTGVIKAVSTLPEEINQKQFRFGFEGVAILDEKIYVATQRAWDGDADPRIHVFDQASGAHEKSLFYPLDAVESVNGGWVGLGGLTTISDGSGDLLVIERDNQGGPDAALKRLYRINPRGLENGDTLEKELAIDLISVLERATNSPVDDKIEGVAFTEDGTWVVNDNDGTDDSNGETTLINLGRTFLSSDSAKGSDVFRFYNQAAGEHLLTSDTVEAAILESTFDPITGSGWKNEGIAFESYQGAGDEDVLRYFNQATGRHLFTLNEFEQSVLEASGEWQLEGFAFGASETLIAGVADTAVERFYNPFTNSHVYSANSAEISLLTSDTSWMAEGVAFYV